jgi:hypothetical protein
MRDDSDHRGTAWGPCLLLAALLLPFAAGRSLALPIGGRASLQFQHVDEHGLVFYPNGIVRDTSISREFWSQSYQLHHAASLGGRFSLFSQLEFVDESYSGRAHVSQTGTATMRLSHPFFGISGSYRPSFSKVTALSLGQPGVVGQFSPTRAHNDQATVTANFVPPGLPRLDLAWVRQQQSVEGSDVKPTTTSRNANLAYATGPLELHAGAGDQKGDTGTGGPSLSDRRHGDAGFGLHVDPLAVLSFGLNYQLDMLETLVPSGPTNRSVGNTGNLSGTWRASEHTGVDLAYSYRNSHQTGGVTGQQASHDGSLTLAYRPNPVATASAGGGFRTLNAARAAILERYLAASASAAGRIRTAWRGSASLTQTTLWDPDEPVRTNESANIATSIRASRDFLLGGNITTGLNSDPTVGRGRWATDAAVNLTASPFRRLQFVAGLRTTKSSTTPLGISPGTNSRDLQAHWFPSAGIDFAGGVSHSHSTTDRGAGSTTLNGRLALRPGQRLTLTSSYARSNVSSQIAGTSQLQGREVLTTEMGLALSRTLSLGATLNLVNPHAANSSRQYDLTLTKEFGR